MKISVVMSTYNGHKYILEQLKSIKEQNRIPDEVIIVDDCSTDGTKELIESFIQSNQLKNWNLSVNNNNKGWRRNFIDAAKLCSGDLVFFADQDDIWLQEKIKIMSDICTENSDIGLLGSNYEEWYEKNKSHAKFPVSNKVEKCKIRKNFYSNTPGCTYCVRKNIIDMSIALWEPDYAHDALAWRIAEFTDQLYFYYGITMRHRMHDDSAYAKECRISKTREQKIQFTEYALRFNKTLSGVLQSLEGEDVSIYIQVLERSNRWLLLRNKFLTSGNPFWGILLARYVCYYSRIRQYVGDWYLVYVKN